MAPKPNGTFTLIAGRGSVGGHGNVGGGFGAAPSGRTFSGGPGVSTFGRSYSGTRLYGPQAGTRLYGSRTYGRLYTRLGVVRRGHWRGGRWFWYDAGPYYGDSCYSSCRAAGYGPGYCSVYAYNFC